MMWDASNVPRNSSIIKAAQKKVNERRNNKNVLIFYRLVEYQFINDADP